MVTETTTQSATFSLLFDDRAHCFVTELRNDTVLIGLYHRKYAGPSGKSLEP
jgi:hypothetical protein